MYTKVERTFLKEKFSEVTKRKDFTKKKMFLTQLFKNDCVCLQVHSHIHIMILGFMALLLMLN